MDASRPHVQTISPSQSFLTWGAVHGCLAPACAKNRNIGWEKHNHCFVACFDCREGKTELYITIPSIHNRSIPSKFLNPARLPLTWVHPFELSASVVECKRVA